MTIAFTRLFTTQGLHCGGLNEVNTYRGTTLADRRADLVTQLATSTVYGELVSTPYSNYAAARDAENTYVGTLQTLALAALLADVDADRPGAGASLTAALPELRRQMVIAGESLNACRGTVTVADVGTPAGDATFVFSTYEPVTGLPTDFLVPDVYLIQCTADRSQDGTAYAETYSLLGKTADSLPTDATYPSGTGLDTAVTVIDPATDESVVSNGGFDTWTVTNIPDDWTLVSGTVAGTNVLKKISDDPRGTDADNISLRLVSTGALIKLRQEISVTANTKLHVHFRVKDVADPGTDWAVSLLLVDSTGANLAGNASYSNIVSSAAAGSLSADWANAVTGTFLVPAVLPADGEVYLEIRMHQSGALTTAPANTAECYVDHVSLIEAEALYDGGPSLIGFSGRTEAVVGDARTATVALDSGAPSAYLIRGMDRLLGLAAQVVRIPTVNDASETQTDALVA